MARKKTYTFIDLFAGIGGFHQAMHSVGMKCVFASEWDKNARISYEANYKDIAPNLFENNNCYFNEDITKQDPTEIPPFDICCGGFPCQPFSIAGLRRGFEDTRGTLFFNIANIVKQKISIGCPPKVLFLENVKGFTHGKFKPIHDQLVKDLRDMGYGEEPLAQAVLNSKDYGIPQNRERLWMFAQLGGLPEGFNIVPDKIESEAKIGDFLDDNPEKKLYLSEAQIEHLKVKHHIDSFVVETPLCFDVYNKKIKRDGYCITITQPEHNSLRVVEVPKADGKEIVRKLSPFEQFRLMGFRISRDLSECEIDFNGQSYTQLSKRAGNGWDVNLVGILLTHIFKQL